MTRRFKGATAVRSSVPLWFGLYGASGAGKTYSALRLAKGIQSVVGGLIGLGDTENGRGAHYADEFRYERYPFEPPFEPAHYLDLLTQMSEEGVSVAIVDSASHEWEGTGGVLEMHESEIARMLKEWKRATRDKVQMTAWAKPKAEHRRMIHGSLRLPLHVIWCFRAREKLEIITGQQPRKLGFMPIASDDLVYEMAMTALLLPNAKGVPTWASEEMGERMMIKLPHWAQNMIRSGKPLDEELGAALARWARGENPGAQVAALVTALQECEASALPGLEGQARALWRGLNEQERQNVQTAVKEAKERLSAK